MFAYEVVVGQLEAFALKHRAANEELYRAWIQLVLMAEAYAALDHHDAETREEALGDAWQDIEAGFRGGADMMASAAALNLLFTAGPHKVALRRAVNRAFRDAWAATPSLFQPLYPDELRQRRIVGPKGPWRPVRPQRGYRLGASVMRVYGTERCGQLLVQVVQLRKVNMQLMTWVQAPPVSATPARPTLTLLPGGAGEPR